MISTNTTKCFKHKKDKSIYTKPQQQHQLSNAISTTTRKVMKNYQQSTSTIGIKHKIFNMCERQSVPYDNAGNRQIGRKNQKSE